MVSNQGCLLTGNLAVRLGNLTYQSYSRNRYYTANKYITYKLLSRYPNVIMTNNLTKLILCTPISRQLWFQKNIELQNCFLFKNLQVPELNMNNLNTHRSADMYTTQISHDNTTQAYTFQWTQNHAWMNGSLVFTRIMDNGLGYAWLRILLYTASVVVPW